MVEAEPISERSLASKGCGLPGDRVESIERTKEHLETSQILTYMVDPIVVVFFHGVQLVKLGFGGEPAAMPEPSEKSAQAVTPATFHPERSWLNEEAARNIHLMSFTAPVSQERGAPPLLNPRLPSNIAFMVVTAPVFQLLMSLLKALACYNTARYGWRCEWCWWQITGGSGHIVNGGEASSTICHCHHHLSISVQRGDTTTRTLNMPAMSITLLVSQLPMSWLKEVAAYSTSREG